MEGESKSNQSNEKIDAQDLQENQKSTGFTEKLVKNISAADTTSEDGCSIVCAFLQRILLMSILNIYNVQK